MVSSSRKPLAGAQTRPFRLARRTDERTASPSVGAKIDVYLVDADAERCGDLGVRLAGTRFCVRLASPVESFLALHPAAGVLLVHDDCAAITRLLADMERYGWWLPIVGYASAPAAGRVASAVLEGALGYIALSVPRAELLTVLAEAVDRAAARSRGARRKFVARDKLGRLTPREVEVLAHMAKGLTNEQIGRKCRIGRRTVEGHRANIRMKLGDASSLSAVRIAVDAGLLDGWEG